LNAFKLDSNWTFTLDGGHFTKSGRYREGVLDSVWHYAADQRDFFVQWTPIEATDDSVHFSVPSVFRVDTSAIGKLRFVRMDNACTDIIEVELRQRAPGIDIDSLFRTETRIDTVRYASLLKECQQIVPSSGAAKIIDIRQRLSERSTGTVLDAYVAHVQFGDRSISLLCITCSGEDYARIIYGDILQSLICRGQYAYSPLVSAQIVSCQ
jgi:hypothetical protein